MNIGIKLITSVIQEIDTSKKFIITIIGEIDTCIKLIITVIQETNINIEFNNYNNLRDDASEKYSYYNSRD